MANTRIGILSCLISVAVAGLFLCGCERASPTTVNPSPPLNVADNPTAEPEWGRLTGHVRFEGKLPFKAPDDESLAIDAESKGIANVVVFLPRRPSLAHPDFDPPRQTEPHQPDPEGQLKNADEVLFEIKNSRFIPHICLIRVGDSIRVINHDQVKHAIQTFPIHNLPVMTMIQAENNEGLLLSLPLKPEKLPTKVIDPTNVAMSAYWFILDHPFVAVTDENGHFEIPQLPVGEHKFMFWHERFGYLKKNYPVEVKQGLNDLESIGINLP